MDGKELEQQVEKILSTRTVSKAQQVMQSKSGLWLIALVSFVEASTPLPVMTDPFVVAAILLNRANSIRIIVVTTIASVLGGIAAYFTAVLFFEVALQLLSPESANTLASLTADRGQGTFVLSLIGAFTPVPYTLTAWAVAALKGNVFVFIAASIIGRGGRYVLVGWLTYRFGETAVKYAKRSIGLLSILLVILAVFYFWYKV